jgi:ABC-type transporter MlaC component
MTSLTICDRCGKPIAGDQRPGVRLEVKRQNSSGSFKVYDLHVACLDELGIWLANERVRLQ